MTLIDTRLDKHGDKLIVFRTRYSRGTMAALFYDEDYAATVISRFMGGDDEATSSDVWFLNDVYPAFAGNSTTEALAKLESHLGKINSLNRLEADTYNDLIIDIVNGYSAASKPDRRMAAIEMPSELSMRIETFRRSLIELKTFDLWLEGYGATGQSGPARLVCQVQGESFNSAVRYYVRTLSADDPSKSYWQYDLHGRGHHVGGWAFWGCRAFDNETDARQSFG